MIKKGSTVEIISGKNKKKQGEVIEMDRSNYCLLYTSPSPRD